MLEIDNIHVCRKLILSARLADDMLGIARRRMKEDDIDIYFIYLYKINKCLSILAA